MGMDPEEAKIYMKYLENPGASIAAISEALNMSPERVQKIVANMVEKGLLKGVPGKELCFDAEEPKKVIEILLERKRAKMEREFEEAKRLSEDVKKSLSALFWEKRLGLKPEDIMEPLSDLREMELRTVRMIEEANREIMIFTRSFGWYSKVKEALLCARDKGARVRVLMKVVDRASARRALELLNLGAEVRQCKEEWYPIVGTIVDGEELIFLVWAVDKTKAKRPVFYRPHYTRNKGIVTVFLEAFEKRWKEAIPLSEDSKILKEFLG